MENSTEEKKRLCMKCKKEKDTDERLEVLGAKAKARKGRRVAKDINRRENFDAYSL